MNETPKTKPGRRILRWSFWIIGSIALLRGMADLFFRLAFQEHPIFPTLTQKILYTLVNLLALAFLLYLLRPIFRLSWRGLFTWRGMRRILVGIAVLATLVALLYAEEDWRGKRAWENCKRELAAKGVDLNWSDYIPAPVPDDQNFFMASTNILLRFHRAQTEAEYEAATNCHWLRIEYSTNSFPVFDSTKTKPLVVAELTVEPSTVALTTGGSRLFAIKLNAADTPEQIQGLIRTTVGRGILGAAGFQFSERQLSNLAPAQIVLQSDTTPSTADLQNLIPENLVTNIGHLRVEATIDRRIFQVVLTGVHITAAADYLKWSDQFEPDFDEIREALKRPYALIPGDYSKPYEQPIPNFVTMRALAQTLAQRTQCYLLLGQPDKALRELTLMHDSCRILQKPPTGKPETLVEAMINVAISGVYVSTVADGFRLHGWQEPQLAALQQQLADINLTPFVFEALQEGPAALCRDAQIAWIPKLFDTTIHAAWTTRIAWWFWPSGWTYQNMVNVAVLEQKPLEGFDLADDTVSPRKFDEWYHYLRAD
jgi:hypothetical protein